MNPTQPLRDLSVSADLSKTYHSFAIGFEISALQTVINGVLGSVACI